MAGGRPTEYDPKYCDELVAHMSKGLSWESFAGKLGVCRQTLYAWAKAHPEFLNARQHGIDANLLFWEEQGNMGLWQDEGGPKLNASIWMFNMKARHHWRDRAEIEVKVESRDLADVPSEQLDNILGE